ncbi:MAG: cob(I)yrinic acid a,c-diamide adenosyltransferase [Candidatus Eremiobacteraeota bacterium]|nr:cob(I)yrinic acid a,c-diamide adenosyltransferase [Candidatus Eremiobacteraeota bacterium]
MPKLTRIYTRTGDDGTTGLVGGQRIKKDALRIETYGTVDELSSALGVARASLTDIRRSRAIDEAKAVEVATQLDAWLAWTQDVLFNIGSDLATPGPQRQEGMPQVTDRDVTALERAIDAAQKDLEPLAYFIHPGGSPAGAQLHLARTIARRTERRLISLTHDEEIPAEILRYFNRLSDALFVWARWINHAVGVPEHRWDPATQPPK